jgi:hypothetical protein
MTKGEPIEPVGVGELARNGLFQERSFSSAFTRMCGTLVGDANESFSSSLPPWAAVVFSSRLLESSGRSDETLLK